MLASTRSFVPWSVLLARMCGVIYAPQSSGEAMPSSGQVCVDGTDVGRDPHNFFGKKLAVCV